MREKKNRLKKMIKRLKKNRSQQINWNIQMTESHEMILPRRLIDFPQTDDKLTLNNNLPQELRTAESFSTTSQNSTVW